MRMRLFVVFIGLTLISSTCNKYNKLLKSSDYNLKYEKALEYYDKKDYTRAMALLEEILPLLRPTAKGEPAYYKYCYCHYYTKEYYLAGYYFRNFSKLYPAGEKAEECLFMSGICNLKNSPRWSLDQTETYEAIKDFQQFLDKYPESNRRQRCNNIIDSLNFKLERKAFENAKLYHKIENYKSASIALKSMLEQYPNTPFKEEAMFLIVESDYLYALNSIESKKLERFEQTIKSYTNFVAAYANSKKRKKADQYYNQALEKVKKSKTN
ncbi:MAG TPA: outer membrane protein assembly factor BamD [Flavobacteriales bacterium]|nr:outer membrane protein assembly factor BamD [Flavobacteriales bacterium]